MLPARSPGPWDEGPRPWCRGANRPALPLLILVASLATATAAARQPVPPEPTRPRVPGFDIPPPPRDPQFPVLPGVFGGRESGKAESAPSAAAPREPQADAAEHLVDTVAGDARDASARNPQAMLQTVALVVAAALTVIAILLRRGRPDRRPASIVRAVPPSAGVRRVDPRPGAAADRRGPAPDTGRSPASTRRTAAASDSPTPPAG